MTHLGSRSLVVGYPPISPVPSRQPRSLALAISSQSSFRQPSKASRLRSTSTTSQLLEILTEYVGKIMDRGAAQTMHVLKKLNPSCVNFQGSNATGQPIILSRATEVVAKMFGDSPLTKHRTGYEPLGTACAVPYAPPVGLTQFEGVDFPTQSRGPHVFVVVTYQLILD